MLSGLADEHVKSAIVAGLRLRGMDVATVQERGLAGTSDEDLLTAATAENRLMLTNDHDFLRIHHDWMVKGKDHSGIVYWAQILPIGDAIRAILRYATVTVSVDAKNMVKFL